MLFYITLSQGGFLSAKAAVAFFHQADEQAILVEKLVIHFQDSNFICHDHGKTTFSEWVFGSHVHFFQLVALKSWKLL